MKRSIIFAGVIAIGLSVMAGDKGEQEDWMKHAREKTVRRAKEAAEHHGNTEYLEKKYGSLKEDHPEKYADMVKKSKAASKAWAKVAVDVAGAEDYNEIHALKTSAYKADSAAEMARLELKAAAAIAGWKHAAEKTGSAEVSKLAEKLSANQKAMLKATQQKMDSSQELHELQQKHSELEKQMRTEYEKARKSQKTHHHKKDKKK